MHCQSMVLCLLGEGVFRLLFIAVLLHAFMIYDVIGMFDLCYLQTPHNIKEHNTNNTVFANPGLHMNIFCFLSIHVRKPGNL